MRFKDEEESIVARNIILWIGGEIHCQRPKFKARRRAYMKTYHQKIKMEKQNQKKITKLKEVKK